MGSSAAVSYTHLHEELVNKYGEEIVANEEIVMHVATDDSMMKKIGTLPSGGECIINKIAADCDLLLAEDVYKRQPHARGHLQQAFCRAH